MAKQSNQNNHQNTNQQAQNQNSNQSSNSITGAVSADLESTKTSFYISLAGAIALVGVLAYYFVIKKR